LLSLPLMPLTYKVLAEPGPPEPPELEAELLVGTELPEPSSKVAKQAKESNAHNLRFIDALPF